MPKETSETCTHGSGRKPTDCCEKLTYERSKQQDQLAIRRQVNKLSREGRHDEAKVILQQLIKMRPDNPLIWNDLGLACDALGQLDEAVESFRRGIEVHSPAFPPLLFHLAKVLLRRFRRDTPLAHRKTPEAKKMLLEINGLLNSNLDQNPGNIEAHKLLAETLKIAEQDELAAAHLEIVRRAERFTE